MNSSDHFLKTGELRQNIDKLSDILKKNINTNVIDIEKF